MSKLIIFGAGNYAEQAYYYFTNDSSYDVTAFTADKQYISKMNLCGLPVIPFDQIENYYPPADYEMFVALGYQNLNKLRSSKCKKVKAKGYKLASYINSTVCNFGKISFGENCFILEHTVLQPGVVIGSNVFIWSANHIGHHSIIGNHCYIAGQVVISGNVSVGANCFLGVNATITHEVQIGEQCLIGAGSLITKDTQDKSVYIAEETPKYRLDSDAFLKLTRF